MNQKRETPSQVNPLPSLRFSFALWLIPIVTALSLYFVLSMNTDSNLERFSSSRVDVPVEQSTSLKADTRKRSEEITIGLSETKPE